jgi:ribonuclease HII
MAGSTGRGAVIGPLVVAGTAFYEGDLPELKKLGVKDSKLHTPGQREKLAGKIEAMAKDVVVIKVDACRIDSYRKAGTNLNMIEGMKFADIINLIRPDECFIDLPENNAGRFGLFVRKMLRDGAGKARLVLEHKADARYPVVSAASIIAKVERDRAIEELKKRYGDIGPGYSSNPVTMKWLEGWYARHRSYPDIVRKTWLTARNVKGDQEQRGLGSFFGLLKGKDSGCGKSR